MKAIQGYLWGVLFMMIPWLVQAQQPGDSINNKAQKRPAYLSTAAGLSSSVFRDFATSPLRYAGTPVFVALGHMDVDHRRQSGIELSYTFGKFSNDFNNHENASKVNIIMFNYAELFHLKSLSTSRLNVKVGGQWTTTVNLRENAALQNNSTGVDILSTLFGSIKGTLKIQDRQSLSATFNLGLINGAYRNGFVYVGHSAPTNQDQFFDQYQFRAFTGYRFNTQLDYTLYFENKNALRFGYGWDAFTTGSDDQFEVASHVFTVTLLFNLR